MAEVYNIGQYRYTGSEEIVKKIYGTYPYLGDDNKSNRLQPIDRVTGVKIDDYDTYYRDVLISLADADDNSKKLSADEVYFIELDIAGTYVGTDYVLKLVDSADPLAKTEFETVKKFTVSQTIDGLAPLKLVYYSDPYKENGDIDENYSPDNSYYFKVGAVKQHVNGVDNILWDGYEEKYPNRNEITLLPSWVMNSRDSRYKYSTAVVTRYYEPLFDSLLLEIDRNTDDTGIVTELKNKDGSVNKYLLGRWLNVENYDVAELDHLDISLYKIHNLLKTSSFNPSQQSMIIKKIGVWGRPGLRLFINNEEIQIGPSGVFEFEGIDITSFGVFANGLEDKFVVDYQYVIDGE